MNAVDRLARLPCKTCKGDTATELVKGVRRRRMKLIIPGDVKKR